MPYKLLGYLNVFIYCFLKRRTLVDFTTPVEPARIFVRPTNGTTEEPYKFKYVLLKFLNSPLQPLQATVP